MATEVDIKPGPWAIRQTLNGLGMTLPLARKVDWDKNGRWIITLPNGEKLRVPREITTVGIQNVNNQAGLEYH